MITSVKDFVLKQLRKGEKFRALVHSLNWRRVDSYYKSLFNLMTYSGDECKLLRDSIQIINNNNNFITFKDNSVLKFEANIDHLSGYDFDSVFVDMESYRDNPNANFNKNIYPLITGLNGKIYKIG